MQSAIGSHISKTVRDLVFYFGIDIYQGTATMHKKFVLDGIILNSIGTTVKNCTYSVCIFFLQKCSTKFFSNYA